jgi:UDP-N-acetylmuramate dehydrogenase
MVIDPADRDTHSVGPFCTNPIVSMERHAMWAYAERPPAFLHADQMKISAAWLIERSGFNRGYRWGMWDSRRSTRSR